MGSGLVMMLPLFLLTAVGDIPGDIEVIRCDRIELNRYYDPQDGRLVFKQVLLETNANNKYGWLPREFLLVSIKDEDSGVPQYDYERKIYRLYHKAYNGANSYIIEAPDYIRTDTTYDRQLVVLNDMQLEKDEICPMTLAPTLQFMKYKFYQFDLDIEFPTKKKKH
jgi:hypothetical protein